MKESSISIIIPAYNAAKFIDKCLSSIRSSKYDKYEIIVVDDCSTDNTVEVANSYGVKIIKLEKNTGPAYARNEGAKFASGNILFFADSDVEFYQNTLNQIAKLFQNDDIHVATGIYSNEPANKGITPLYKALFMYYHFTKSPVENYNIFSASCGAIRKDTFIQIGGFNSNIKWGLDLENDEFGYRINKLYKNPVIPEIQVKHNFPYFFNLLKIMFRRTYYWTLYFFKRKKFDDVISTPMMGIANGIAPLILLSSIAAFLDKSFIVSTISLFVFYVASYSGFLKYIISEKKYKQFLPILIVAFSVSVVIGTAAIFAFIKKIFTSMRILKSKDEFETIIQNI